MSRLNANKDGLMRDNRSAGKKNTSEREIFAEEFRRSSASGRSPGCLWPQSADLYLLGVGATDAASQQSLRNLFTGPDRSTRCR